MYLLALVACTESESTDESGSGAETVTDWTEDQMFDADYTVAADESLTISPGLTLTFERNARLIVEGELIARGTESDEILFTGDAGARWGGIVFTEGSVDAEYADIGEYTGGSILEFVTVEKATRGVEIDDSSPYVHRVLLANNEIATTVETIGGAGMLVENGAQPRLRGVTFSENTANTFAYGGGLYVHHADPIIQDCAFESNVGSYGAGMSTDWMASPIVGSSFDLNESQSEGGGISLVSSVSAVLNNSFKHNLAEADGAGVHVCLTCDPHAVPTLYDNVIGDNISDNDDPDDGAAGIGAAFLGGFANNDIYGNLRGETPSDFGWYNIATEGWPAWASSPVLTDTYWGTTDPEAIAATVYDGADSTRYGTVDVSSPRSSVLSVATPRVVVSTREVRYEDAGEDMPVFLTVYNPGSARSVDLSITKDGAAWSEAIELPGAEVTRTGWHVDLQENSVWFGTLNDSTYDGVTVGELEWAATLTEPSSGVQIGVTSYARAVLSPAAE